MRSRKGTKKKRDVDVPGVLMALGIEFRPQGYEYWACCPSPTHHERTASWSISDTGGHHCFGCKWQGGILELVERVVGLSSWSAASQWIESKGLYSDGPVPMNVKLNVKRPFEGGEMEWPGDARQTPISEWVTPARRYAKKRGLTEAQAARWRLGYATGGYYASRILLPTYSRAGRLLNITGRAWSKSKSPKYLNANELRGWAPGAIFGEQFWNPMPTRDTLVLCEGELNALACERVGVQYVGALGGSQLEKEQVMKLSKFGKVVIAVDMDRAGSDVARALQATLVRWRRVGTVRFPDDRDPNDLERTEPGLLSEIIKEAS